MTPIEERVLGYFASVAALVGWFALVAWLVFGCAGGYERRLDDCIRQARTEPEARVCMHSVDCEYGRPECYAPRGSR